jgi:Zn-dependent protease
MIVKLLSLLAKILWVKELGMLNGIALIISIYVHEYGHYLMADELGLKPKHPRFIPFLGAYVEHNETFNQKEHFKVAIMGPLLGGILGIISFYIDLIFNIKFFHQVAVFSLLLNLLNLIPFAILDGGHIVKSLGFNKFQLLVTIIIIIISIKIKKYFLIILGIFGLLNYLYSNSIKDKLEPMNEEDRGFGIFIYVGLIIILAIHTYFILK